MKKVLYISNIEVPYRVKFFNKLSEYCDLTVVFERKKSSNRDKKWTESESKNFKSEYLGGIKIKNENAFSFKILKYIFGGYDSIILGCYNSPVIMFAILIMRIFRKKYILNLDGEIFLDNSFKSKIKKFFLKGAEKYLTAGEKSAESLKKISGKRPVLPYYFSSLDKAQIKANSNKKTIRNKTVLVVGQYFDYKGMDIALKAALLDQSINYKFVGMGNRTELFIKDTNSENVSNIEFIPFLQKEELEKEYMECAVLLLPSRQECWGLVINEAASFGMPIVSTYGSGAAVEFIGDDYPCYLARPDNPEELYDCIKKLFESDVQEYSEYLIKKSENYSIEKSVEVHLRACGIDMEG